MPVIGFIVAFVKFCRYHPSDCRNAIFGVTVLAKKTEVSKFQKALSDSCVSSINLFFLLSRSRLFYQHQLNHVELATYLGEEALKFSTIILSLTF